jgi:hypothetical protein
MAPHPEPDYPDFFSPFIAITRTGVEIKFAGGEKYWAVEASLTAGQNPTYELPFEAKNLTIISTADIQIKLNDDTNDVVKIKKGIFYIFDMLKITKVFIINTTDTIVNMFSTD